MAMQQRILTQARRVLITTPSASMQVLAKEIGIGRATLYRYFYSREALIESLAMKALDAAEQASERAKLSACSYGEYFEHLLVELIDLGDQYYFSALVFAFTENEAVLLRHKQQMHKLYQAIEEAKKEDFFAENIPTRWIAHALDAMLYTCWKSINQQDLTAEVAKKLMLNTLLNGLNEGYPNEH